MFLFTFISRINVWPVDSCNKI